MSRPSQRPGRGSRRFQPHGARPRAIMSSFAKGKRVPRAVPRSAPRGSSRLCPADVAGVSASRIAKRRSFQEEKSRWRFEGFPCSPLSARVPNGARVLCRVLGASPRGPTGCRAACSGHPWVFCEGSWEEAERLAGSGEPLQLSHGCAAPGRAVLCERTDRSHAGRGSRCGSAEIIPFRLRTRDRNRLGTQLLRGIGLSWPPAEGLRLAASSDDPRENFCSDGLSLLAVSPKDREE